MTKYWTGMNKITKNSISLRKELMNIKSILKKTNQRKNTCMKLEFRNLEHWRSKFKKDLNKK